jgi:hypothetical protein
MIGTLYRSTVVIKRLHKERNFNVKNDGPTMQTVIDYVMQRTLTNDEIIKEIIEAHTIELPLVT